MHGVLHRRTGASSTRACKKMASTSRGLLLLGVVPPGEAFVSTYIHYLRSTSATERATVERDTAGEDESPHRISRWTGLKPAGSTPDQEKIVSCIKTTFSCSVCNNNILRSPFLSPRVQLIFYFISTISTPTQLEPAPRHSNQRDEPTGGYKLERHRHRGRNLTGSQTRSPSQSIAATKG